MPIRVRQLQCDSNRSLKKTIEIGKDQLRRKALRQQRASLKADPYHSTNDRYLNSSKFSEKGVNKVSTAPGGARKKDRDYLFLLPVHLRANSIQESRKQSIDGGGADGQDDDNSEKFYIFDQNNRIYAAKPILGSSMTAPMLDPVR